jgi:subtilisin family serine protease
MRLSRWRPARRPLRFEALEPRCLLSAAAPTDLTGLDQVRRDFGFTGAGQTVAVIDTGIAYDHVALGQGFGPGYRVVGGLDFTTDGHANPYDTGPNGGHGTHVAGIIASTAANSTGVAPGVDLVALRVFADNGSGQFDWVADALQWVHNNRNAFAHPITTVNLSLGGQWNSSTLPAWATLENALAKLEADGIFVAVAAGNSFQAYNQPGLGYPAASPHVVPVGSIDGDGSLSYFSQREGRMIAAPGRSILSTVPDYLGDRDGVADDFARFSGTSMAAPYVAGASVLLRQAYEFVGVNTVSEQTLYNLMVTTADTVFDPATGQSYHRLNIDRAVESIMPADDYGSTAATASALGTISGNRSLTGAIARLADQDWFTFTAGASGSVRVTVGPTGDLLPRWHAVVGAGGTSVDASGKVLTFNVIAGQSYSVGLATAKGLGHYTLDVRLEPRDAGIDWGVVRQGRFDNTQVTAAGRWFTLAAGADGILTIEALRNSNVALQLFDAQGRLVATGRASGDSVRIDVTARAGETFRLRAWTGSGGASQNADFRVTNLVCRSGNTVRIAGTEAGDSFAFRAGSNHQVTVNGVVYQFDAATVTAINFDGRGGSDSIVLETNGGNASAMLRVGSAELTGSAYKVRATSVETVLVRAAAGSNRAVFYDSPGDDVFVAGPGYAGLSGAGFAHRVEGFQTVYAYATAGGRDTAIFCDPTGNGAFTASPRDARLMGRGFNFRAWGFQSAYLRALSAATSGNERPTV